MLVSKTALARAVVGSWRGGSANEACQVRRSFILAGLIDLAVRRFKHGGDLGNLWRSLEPSELISSHGQVGAWGLVDIVAVDMDKFIVEVAAEWAWPPLRVELLSVASSLG